MYAFLVEILDPLQDHRVEPGPDHELTLEPVITREMPADRKRGAASTLRGLMMG